MGPWAFAELESSKNLLQNSAANVLLCAIPSTALQGIKDPSKGAAHLPLYKRIGSAHIQIGHAAEQLREIFRSK